LPFTASEVVEDFAIALVDEQTPSVFLVPQGAVFDKVMARRAPA